MEWRGVEWMAISEQNAAKVQVSGYLHSGLCLVDGARRLSYKVGVFAKVSAEAFAKASAGAFVVFIGQSLSFHESPS